MTMSTAPSVTGLMQPASRELADARSGMRRAAVSSALGLSTRARADTPLSLSEAEVMDIAQDYSDPRLGEGLARLDQPLGEEWPDAKGAIWLGQTGHALELDASFRAVAGEIVPDLAELLKSAVTAKSDEQLNQLLERMR